MILYERGTTKRDIMGKWVHKLSNVDMTNNTANCSECGPVNLMYGKRCGNARKTYENSEHRKNLLKNNRANRTYEDRGRTFKYEGGSFYLSNKRRLDLLQEHGYICGICKIILTNSSARLDHCHTTGKIRGFLCNSCNFAIGLFGDNIEFLSNAINYLK